MDVTAASLFTISAIALLGSPGPAIAALMAIARANGFRKVMYFNIGLQVGLALAAGISAMGLYSVLIAIPSVAYGMSIAAAAYLLYLSYKIATADVGNNTARGQIPSSVLSGFFLGLTNPKAYIVFVSLYASYTLFPDAVAAVDTLVKWLLCVAVMIVVDMIWLMVGLWLRRANLNDGVERGLNIVFALMVIGSTVSLFL